jgi:hypothetical protein
MIVVNAIRSRLSWSMYGNLIADILGVLKPFITGLYA